MSHSRTDAAIARLAELTPRQIVAELDRHIVGQQDAKRAVAVALRNRWRRQRAPESLRDAIAPNNIILIGPTGCGKTEIARRVAKIAGAPFVKVEASKFTEVGYVGRDVESMVRDLADNAVDLVREEREAEIEDLVSERVDERLLDLLMPPADARDARDAREPRDVRDARDARDAREPGFAPSPTFSNAIGTPYSPEPTGGIATSASPAVAVAVASAVATVPAADAPASERLRRTRDKLRALLIDGNLDNREVEIEVEDAPARAHEYQGTGSAEGMESFAEWFREMLPKRKRQRTVKVSEARRILMDQEFERLVDHDDVAADAIERVEATGIVFLDEIDKIAGERGSSGGPDVSRGGVQRDLLPIIEGSTVSTRHGTVRTDNILFIAAGAFHVSKPSDLIPELQGRFPIRVELKPLTEADFVRVLTEPEGSLLKQYSALVEAEGAALEFEPDGIAEIARVATRVNERVENIGARRLHTVMTALLEDVLFALPDESLETVTVGATMVRDRLDALSRDDDLRRYIL